VTGSDAPARFLTDKQSAELSSHLRSFLDPDYAAFIVPCMDSECRAYAQNLASGVKNITPYDSRIRKIQELLETNYEKGLVSELIYLLRIRDLVDKRGRPRDDSRANFILNLFGYMPENVAKRGFVSTVELLLNFSGDRRCVARFDETIDDILDGINGPTLMQEINAEIWQLERN